MFECPFDGLRIPLSTSKPLRYVVFGPWEEPRELLRVLERLVHETRLQWCADGASKE
jgi:hypothetical protein